jgi:hypothetical protein
MKKGLLTFGICSAIVGGLVYLCKSVKEEITVNNKEWERSVEIEEYKEVEESSDTVPEGATVTKVTTKTIKETPDQIVKKLLCYTYTIKKWVFKEAVIAASTTEAEHYDEPYFPEYENLGENERFNNRKESYYITDTNGNRWSIDYDKWAVLNVGERVTIKHGRINNYISKIER